MLLRRALPFAIAIFGFSRLPSAFAQATADVEAAVGVKLTLTFNTVRQDRYLKSGAYESTTQFKSLTLTSRAVLEELIFTQRIAGPLSGWKLVARASNTGALALDYRLYAVKAGQPDYALDDGDVDALHFENAFFTSGYKETYYGGDHFTGSGKICYNAVGGFAFAGRDLFLAGNVTAPYTYKVFTTDGEKTSVGLPGTISAKLNGGMVFTEEGYNDISVLIDGTLTFSGHRIIAAAE